MLTPNSYRDEPFAWLPSTARAASQSATRRLRDHSSFTEGMAEHSEENVPLLSANATPAYATAELPMEEQNVMMPEQHEEEDESSQRLNSGTTVHCRVCDAIIQLEGRSMQHVVKCGSCQEATPIRPAPPGKKYVRCPCNCLLICKASSTRIACPRQNCRRVITLGQQESSSGTAMQAPTGTCRVTCAYCSEVFMFNTLSNTLAVCPHCKRRSAVGSSYRRSRLIFFSIGLGSTLLAAIVFTVITLQLSQSSSVLPVLGLLSLLVALYGIVSYFAYKVFLFWSARISTIVAPV